MLAAAAVVGLAACGGGSKPPPVAGVGATTTSASAVAPTQTQLQESLLKFAACMRANGEPNFPDPSSGGFQFRVGSGVDPSSPAFGTAHAKCAKFLPIGAGLAPGAQTHPTTQWLAQMVKAAECMRGHGIPNFPDPGTSVPRSLGAGVREVSDIDGVIFVFPSSLDPQSPAFVRAAVACKFPLHNH
ncbi:MAG TPA: hypothetical protein VNC40_04470 [Gaiellaceae bacterium]|nr:hypothetical protein [Gaiellaceae bacterium]